MKFEISSHISPIKWNGDYHLHNTSCPLFAAKYTLHGMEWCCPVNLQFVAKTDFPVLSCNVDVSQDQFLNGKVGGG
jgi:hypothetical protein